MSWKLAVPEVSLKIWRGPYRGQAPVEGADGPLKAATLIEETEFSIQCFKGKKALGPVHRIPKDKTLEEVWRELTDYRE
jgi:hypothetical protein